MLSFARWLRLSMVPQIVRLPCEISGTRNFQLTKSRAGLLYRTRRLSVESSGSPRHYHRRWAPVNNNFLELLPVGASIRQGTISGGLDMESWVYVAVAPFAMVIGIVAIKVWQRMRESELEQEVAIAEAEARKVEAELELARLTDRTQTSRPI